jgi:lysophospholipase L1-like esterase
MKTLLLLGDSLIEYGDWRRAFPGCRCLNFGVAGETAGGLLHRLPTILQLDDVPDSVVTMTGTNNLAMDDYYFLPQYAEILGQLRNAFPLAKIVATSLLPVPFPWQPATLVPNLNDRLAEICRQVAVFYLDLYSHYSHFQDALANGVTVFDDDGVHLSSAGYDLWRLALLEHLY